MATAITCIEFNECIECIPLGSVPGVNTILVCSRANLGFWYYLESDTLQYNTIIGNELNPNWYTIECKKELTIFASRNSVDFENAKVEMKKGMRNLSRAITHFVPFAEVPEFFRTIQNNNDSVTKALIEF